MECIFDGNCDLCNDANTTLQFEDGSSLRTHLFILRKASGTLRRRFRWWILLGRSIHVRCGSKEIWTKILTELYPTRHSSILEHILTSSTDVLVSINSSNGRDNYGMFTERDV